MIIIRHPLVVLTFFLVSIFPAKNTLAQEMAGFVPDNMAGVNRGIINPAAIFDSPNCLDISLVTGNFGVQNNYVFLPRGTFSLRDLANFRNTYFAEPGEYFSTRENIGAMHARQNFRLQGPSVLFKYKNHSFAFVNSIRGVSSVKRIPDHMVNFFTYGLTYTPQHNIPFNETRAFSVASLGWAEIGLGYATQLVGLAAENINLGITAKYLMGYHGLSARSEELLYEVNEQRDVFFNRFNSNSYLSLPFDYFSNDFTGFESPVNGRGLAFDLGVTYTQKGQSVQPGRANLFAWDPAYADYKYRVGFSLLDLGAIRFRENTRQVVFENADFVWLNPQWEDYLNLDELVTELRENQNSGEINSIEGEPFSIFLPSAASLQLDYNFGNNFFTYFMWVQDIPFTGNRVARSSQIGVIPRYETRWFAVALPITLHEYRTPRVGLSLRLAFLTIGTEQPGGLLNINDMYGADFYFSISWGFKNCWFNKRTVNPCLNGF